MLDHASATGRGGVFAISAWPRTSIACLPALRWSTSTSRANGWSLWGHNLPAAPKNRALRRKQSKIKQLSGLWGSQIPHSQNLLSHAGL